MRECEENVNGNGNMMYECMWIEIWRYACMSVWEWKYEDMDVWVYGNGNK